MSSGKTDKLPERLESVLKALAEKKTDRLVLLDVAELTGYTDFFVIGSGTSSTHVQALADEVARILKKPTEQGVHLEGDPAATWVLIDAGDFIVHLFQPDTRKYYDLEELWLDAPRIKIPT